LTFRHKPKRRREGQGRNNNFVCISKKDFGVFLQQKKMFVLGKEL
jgi:hypothetical protein